MKIIFICRCLEPGKDGVGDYTRRLAGEIIQQGIQAGIIAFKDGFIAEEVLGHQYSLEVSIPVLRIPKTWKPSKRCKLAKDWINLYNPEWLSLQFVPYSFNDKGLPFGLDRQLMGLGSVRKWHIMFHELWLGKDDNFNIKNRIYGNLQRRIIKKLIGRLNPLCVHTHLPAYQKNLKDIGTQAKALPLYSNISTAVKRLSEKKSESFVIGFFSQVDDSQSVLDFLFNINSKLGEKDRRLIIKLIGGNEEKNVRVRNKIISMQGFEVEVLITGFLNPVELSLELKSCDLGITPLPRHCLGKSGSVAAFLTLGIPVAAPSVSQNYKNYGIGFFNPNLKSTILTMPDLNQLEKVKTAAKKAGVIISLPSIANVFLSDLKLTSTENYKNSDNYKLV